MTNELQSYKGQSVQIKLFKGKTFELRGFEHEEDLWLLLEDVLKTLKLKESDIAELRAEEPEYFDFLSDGAEIIKEGGFYYLSIFVSGTPESQEFAHWVFKDVLGSIYTKGYFAIQEDKS